MESEAPSYRGFRFPPEVIAHAVWLYHRLRDVEELCEVVNLFVYVEVCGLAGRACGLATTL
ncbi:transposase-like protein [Streptomyces sp. V4I8]